MTWRPWITPLPVFVLPLLLGASVSAAQEHDMKEIIDFRTPDPEIWSIVNDGVMGGRSSSTSAFPSYSDRSCRRMRP